MTQRRLAPVIGAALLAATVSLAQPGPMRRHPMGKHAVPPACQQMMEELKATDARFDEAVKRMNETQGNERIDAMVAALNELAVQRHAMRAHMASMPCAGMSGGMPGCPMMGR